MVHLTFDSKSLGEKTHTTTGNTFIAIRQARTKARMSSSPFHDKHRNHQIPCIEEPSGGRQACNSTPWHLPMIMKVSGCTIRGYDEDRGT